MGKPTAKGDPYWPPLNSTYLIWPIINLILVHCVENNIKLNCTSIQSQFLISTNVCFGCIVLTQQKIHFDNAFWLRFKVRGQQNKNSKRILCRSDINFKILKVLAWFDYSISDQRLGDLLSCTAVLLKTFINHQILICNVDLFGNNPIHHEIIDKVDHPRNKPRYPPTAPIKSLPS